MMLTQIGGRRESDFTEPLGMLSDCHKRIQLFLRSLSMLAEDAAGLPPTGPGPVPPPVALTEARRTRLDTALRYFRESAPNHTADEEESLFPRLRRGNTDEVRKAFAKMDRLEVDHIRAEAMHRDVETIGAQWMENGVITNRDAARLVELLDSLSALYDRHILVEETEIFPMADVLLPESEKIAVGVEMARRRGITSLLSEPKA